VAGNAIIVTQMIKRRFGPIFRVGVAVDTRAGFAGKTCGSSYWIAAGTDLLISHVEQSRFNDLDVMSGRVIGRMAGAAFRDASMFVVF
jgi:hypothetical protein